MQIPSSLRAGTTWEWTDALPDYPAPTWTLTYSLFKADNLFSLSSQPDGEKHLFRFLPAATAVYDPGRYSYSASVGDGTDIVEIARGYVSVEPSLAPGSDPYDGRTHARKMLDAIQACLLGKATDGQLGIVQVDLGARRLVYNTETLIKLRQLYALEVREEAKRDGDLPGFVQWRFE